MNDTRLCLCRCGESPSEGSVFVHGHDGRLIQKLLNAMGGYEMLRCLVETYQQREISDDDLTTCRVNDG